MVCIKYDFIYLTYFVLPIRYFFLMGGPYMRDPIVLGAG